MCACASARHSAPLLCVLSVACVADAHTQRVRAGFFGLVQQGGWVVFELFWCACLPEGEQSSDVCMASNDSICFFSLQCWCVYYRERESSSSRRVRASWTEPALISSQKHDASSHLAVRRGGKAHHFCAIKAGGGVLVVLSSCGAAHSTRTVNPAQRTSYILYWHCGTSAMPVERHLAGALAGIQHLCVVHSFPPWVGWALYGVAGCRSPCAAPSPCTGGTLLCPQHVPGFLVC